ncbi:MAG: site-specific DNA-methyltransferase [Patescibacteria group bacterium]|nr:MAG: site-specific DNA-methyltransferase [Patescibacteria group bacterium]
MNQLLNQTEFYEALERLFVGLPVEGDSGYVHLMRVKAKYFKNVLLPHLQKEINNVIQCFPSFEQELFEMMYSFFKSYFNESGSIGFFFGSDEQVFYDRIYVDDDLSLFWKSARFYYVKTDRLFRSMKVEIDGVSFFFDVSNMQHKKANEKRELIFKFEDYKDGTLVFSVEYAEGKNKTDLNAILSVINEKKSLSEKTLKKAFRVFERQKEVDYFICKDAKGFLREQFDLWLWQRLFGRPSEMPPIEIDETRLKWFQSLKRVAYCVIDLIAAFEDELVCLWNAPKFVIRSGYVITLDRIYNLSPELVKELVGHPEFHKQMREWQDLGFVDESFTIDSLWECNLMGKCLDKRYQYLPVDTRYFKDLETKILDILGDVDEVLDGWLVKSDNYQALITLLPKFREKVQTIYIDPPFNREQDTTYLYNIKYKESVWATMLENRLSVAKEFLSNNGSIFVRCDYTGNWIVRYLMNVIFGKENFRNEIIIRRGAPKAGLISQFENIRAMTIAYENIYWFSKNVNARFPGFYREASQERKRFGSWSDFQKGEVYDRPTMRYEILGVNIEKGQWKWSKERAMRAVENYQKYLEESKTTGESIEEYWFRTGQSLEFIKRVGNKIKYWVHPREKVLVDNNWLDIMGYSSTTGFQTENAEVLLKRVIESTTKERDIVMDFFLGSGTTSAVAHKLRRRWIGIELGSHFWTVVLPRMKRVLFYDKTGISKDKDVKEIYNEHNAGGFFQYCELEQYEDLLRKLDL